MGSFTETQNDPKCLLVESRIWENLVVKSGVMGFWNLENNSRIPESHYQLQSRIQVPLTKTGIQYLESRITAWSPESKTVLDSLTWGDKLL